MVSVVARFTVRAGGATLDPSSRLDIIRVNQPSFTNHKGGNIAFGPDGLLYLGSRRWRLAAAIHRGMGRTPTTCSAISCASTSAMRQPRRPMRSRGARRAIRSRTIRFVPPRVVRKAAPRSTPRVCAIRGAGASTRLTGDLWVGDVGQGAREEIDRVERGGNYGWNCREGLIAYNSCPTPARRISTIPCTTTGGALGASVTGGYVYRGSALPALVGRYVFARLRARGRIWRLVPNGGAASRPRSLLDTSLSIAAFGQGNDGELYVVHIGAAVQMAVAQDRRRRRRHAAGPPVPTLLSATGCVNPQNPAQPADGSRSVRACGAVLVGQRDEGALARDPEQHVDRRRRRRRLQLPERHGAHEALPLERRSSSRRGCSCAIPTAIGRATPTNGTRSAPMRRSCKAARP